MNAIIMTEEYWAHSQFSIARHYGRIRIGTQEYKIVNKHGITLAELSDPRSGHFVREGKAIPPGEPADLVRKDWIPIYKKLGREKTIELVENNVPLSEAKKLIKNEKQ